MKIEDIKNVTVAGGGTQGSQIASQIAYKGFAVTVWVRSEASVECARVRFATIKKQYLSTLEAMKADASAYCRGLADTPDLSAEQIDALVAQAEERLSAIKFETDWDAAFGNADLVVECINENPQEKTEFYAKLSGHLPERTVILTDSSTMLPSMFAEATGRPDKYMSLHFGNQIWRNNMTELMRHDGTDPEVFELAAQFAEAIGMVPLKLNREQPGYILNSLLIPWFKAATQLVATGADPGLAPFRKLDKIGLVLARNILSMDPAAKDPASGLAKSVAMLNGYIDEGKTGIAAGEGFYKYESYDK